MKLRILDILHKDEKAINSPYRLRSHTQEELKEVYEELVKIKGYFEDVADMAVREYCDIKGLELDYEAMREAVEVVVRDAS